MIEMSNIRATKSFKLYGSSFSNDTHTSKVIVGKIDSIAYYKKHEYQMIYQDPTGFEMPTDFLWRCRKCGTEQLAYSKSDLEQGFTGLPIDKESCKLN